LRYVAFLRQFPYFEYMTQAVAHILNEVEKLSPPEQLELRQLICERIMMSGDLTDDDFAALAASSFRDLDKGESRGALKIIRPAE